MKKRMVLMLAATFVVLGLLGSFKFFQIRAAMAQGAFQMPPEAVTTAVVERADWPATLGAIGTIAAVEGVTVAADLPGVVETVGFESGQRVKAGQVLVRLDTSQEEAQRAAAEAEREWARVSHERLAGLRSKGVASQAELDQAAAANKQGEARVGEIAATISRKTIRAPFSGILGIRQVNRGQYLSPGDPIVSLQALDPIYVNFSLPQQAVGWLRIGSRVEAALEGGGENATPFLGAITAVDAVVEEATRNVAVQATFSNPDGRLRPGMFVRAEVSQGASEPVLVLPASAISYAPYGDSVFVVEDLPVEGKEGETYRGVRQQFVKLGPARGDLVAVASGVEQGQEVVTSGAFKLRGGAAVLVNNEIQPAASSAPEPEDS